MLEYWLSPREYIALKSQATRRNERTNERTCVCVCKEEDGKHLHTHSLNSKKPTSMFALSPSPIHPCLFLRCFHSFRFYIHCNQRAHTHTHTRNNTRERERRKKLLLFNCCYDLVPPYYMLYVCSAQ